MERFYIGIEIGGTKLQLVLGDANSRILERKRLTVEKTLGGPGIRDQISRTLPILSTGRMIGGVGIGFGGPVDWRQKKIACSHQIEGWSGFDFGTWLRTFTDAPIRMDNDANTAAFGEASLGAGQGFNPVYYVTLGSGVGGGLVTGGSIYHGALPGEAEIGHLRLGKDGTILESRCSGWAVDARIRTEKEDNPESLLTKAIGTEAKGEARHLAAAVAANDRFAQKILSEIADDLAFALSHVTHLMHPELIVLGGGLSLIGEALRAGVEAALPQYVMHAFHPVPRIALAGLGEDSVPVGALLLARSAQK
jgi:glucokinase